MGAFAMTFTWDHFTALTICCLIYDHSQKGVILTNLKGETLQTMLFNVQDLPGIKPRQVKILQEQGIMTAQAFAKLAITWVKILRGPINLSEIMLRG